MLAVDTGWLCNDGAVGDPSCRQLVPSNNALTGAIPASFGSLTGLT
jgi:hypothetical protein